MLCNYFDCSDVPVMCDQSVVLRVTNSVTLAGTAIHLIIASSGDSTVKVLMPYQLPVVCVCISIAAVALHT
jgi:hypothetical protein